MSPVIGGPCDYRSYEGRCRLVDVAFEPREGRDGVLFARARYMPLGEGPMFTEALERPVPLAERDLVTRYYRAYAEVGCRGSVIRSGTCTPETSSFDKPHFDVPGAPANDASTETSGVLLACQSSPSVATCNAAGYAATFTRSSDPEAAENAYARAARLEIEECRSGYGRACTSLAFKARFGLGMKASPEDADRLLAIACRLHEPGTCLAGTRDETTSRDASAD